MTPSPEPSLRKRVIKRLDSLAAEMNRCLAVAAIGLACVDLVGYAAIFSQSYVPTAYAAQWSGAVDSVGAAPIIGADTYSR
jgi:hypothetical protein